MARRWIGAVLALALSATGCSGMSGRDAARLVGEIGATLLVAAAAAAIEEAQARERAGLSDRVTSGGEDAPLEVCEWSCPLDGGEEQIVHAHTAEGARAVCLQTNDVDPNGPACRCHSISPDEWACD